MSATISEVAATVVEPREAELPSLRHGALAMYSLPNAVCGFAFMLANVYFLKYSTDTLGVSVVAMGWIFFAARIWDAISDPIVGYLSDRTRTRLGRRRPWIVAGSVPLAFALVAMWGPPAWLSGTALTLWVGASFLLFYTTITSVNVPHESLGAELSLDYTERTRVFAWRRVAFGGGALFAMAAIYALTGSELVGEARRQEARQIASSIAMMAGVAAVALCVVSVSRMRERPAFRARPVSGPLRAFSDVLRNPHARLIIFVFFLQQVGVMSLSTSLAFFADYVLRDEQTAPLLMFVLFAGSTASIPLWVVLTRKREKRDVLLGAMIAVCAVMAALFFVEAEDVWLLYGGTAFAALAVGALDVIFPSMCADVIDYDELATGERKEGSYYAAWSFGQKSAAGVAGLIVSGLLAASGYSRDVAPDDGVLLAIRYAFAGVPFVCFLLGTLLFMRFRLDSKTHAAIRAQIDGQSGSGPS